MDIKYFTDLIEFFMQCNICLRVNTDLKKVGGRSKCEIVRRNK